MRLTYTPHVLIICSILLFCCTELQAQGTSLPSARKRAVYGNGYYVSASNLNYATVAKDAVREPQSKYEKARDLYLWVCRNISYDTHTNIRTADECWTNRRAVCQGYCELYYRMAECIGLDVDIVYGKCRNASGQMEEHGWLCIKTENGRILADPTWGAGSVVNGQFHHLSRHMLWFDVKPQWFIFTHLPANKRFQLMERKITEEEFNRLHYTSPLLEAWGINAHEALQRSLNEDTHFPYAQTLHASFLEKIRFQDAPQTYHLLTNLSYTFCIEKMDKDCEVTLKLGEEIYEEKRWKKEGNLYYLELTPTKPGDLELQVTTTRGFVHLTQTVANYQVK